MCNRSNQQIQRPRVLTVHDHTGWYWYEYGVAEQFGPYDTEGDALAAARAATEAIR